MYDSKYIFCRKKPKAFDFLKVVLKYAFSQIGVIILCIVYAVGGANMYMRYSYKDKYIQKHSRRWGFHGSPNGKHP